MITACLDQIHEYATRSAAVGGFDPADAHFTRTPLKLDKQGWTDLARASKQWLRETARIEKASARRLNADPDVAIDVGLVILLFEALPFSADVSSSPKRPRTSTSPGKRPRRATLNSSRRAAR